MTFNLKPSEKCYFSKYKIALFLILTLIFSTLFSFYPGSSLTVHAQNVTLNKGARIPYQSYIPEADSYATHYYTYSVDGVEHVAYCIEAHHPALAAGDYEMRNLSGEQYELLVKIIACGYGSPYSKMDQIWPGITSEDPIRAYLYTHIAATYAYIGAFSSSSPELWYKGINEDISEKYQIADFIELCSGMRLDLAQSYVNFVQDDANPGHQKVAFYGNARLLEFGSLTIKKEGEVLTDFRDGNFIWENNGLPGTVFEIRAKGTIYDSQGNVVYQDGNLVKTITTNKKGIAKARGLHLGTYSIIEVTPTEGFVKDVIVRRVTFSSAHLYAKETIYNQRQTIDLSVKKLDSASKSPVKGGLFTLYSAEDITNIFGRVIVPAETKIAQASANAKGQIKFPVDLAFGKYYVKETIAPEDYKLNPSPLQLTFQYPSSEIPVLEVRKEFFNEQLFHFAYLSLTKREDTFLSSVSNYQTGEDWVDTTGTDQKRRIESNE